MKKKLLPKNGLFPGTTAIYFSETAKGNSYSRACLPAIPLFFICLLFLISCNDFGPTYSGNGNVVTESRQVEEFHEVRSKGSIDVVIRATGDKSVEVENDENLIQFVETRVENGVLEISYKENTSISNDHAIVYVSAPSLDKISSSGSGDIKTEGTIKSDGEMVFESHGSGDIEASIDAPKVAVSGFGSGDFALRGKTKDFSCSVKGSGVVQCKELRSENTEISIFGSADAHVYASVSLSVSIFGSGNVYYSGDASNPKITMTGSGEVQKES